MAKQIKATPELKGEEADNFLKKMIKLESSRVNTQQKRFAKEIEQNMKLIVVS